MQIINKDQMKEILKDIEGYEGLYQISNLGNVKSLISNKILKPKKDKDGYLMVNLYKQGKVKTYKIHRLVTQAFIENPNNYLEVNHRDEDKTNNYVTNLEWCTREYNNNYGTRNKKTSKPVMCLETGKVYYSANEAARQTGFAQGNISLACNGKLKQAYGYTWKYVE